MFISLTFGVDLTMGLIVETSVVIIGLKKDSTVNKHHLPSSLSVVLVLNLRLIFVRRYMY